MNKNQSDLDVDSDVDDLNFENFKGIHFGDKVEKYQDPVTGCHFRYSDLCQRLVKMKAHRKMIDKRLGIPTSSQIKSPQPNRANKEKPTGNKVRLATDPTKNEQQH